MGRARAEFVNHPTAFRAAGLQGCTGDAGPGFLRRARFCSFARAPLAGDTVFAWNAIEGGYAARFATKLILDERLEAVVFFGREGEVPPWSGLAEVWRLERLDATARRFLLAGRTASTSFDASPTICVCFGVKSQAILSAIADGARSTEAIGMIAAARAPQKAQADLPA